MGDTRNSHNQMRNQKMTTHAEKQPITKVGMDITGVK